MIPMRTKYLVGTGQNLERKLALRMKYKLVKDLDLKKVEEEVNRLMEEGWELQGACAMAAKAGGDCVYVQTLIRNR